jgi:arsenate reductase
MKKIYYLKTCDTCKRILSKLQLDSSFELQDIKSTEITVKQLQEMKALAGSYEALFSKRAKLYKERNLKNETLTEEDYKSFILEHYTFLKRPVIIVNHQIFVGNSPKTVEAAQKAINE